MKGCSPWNALCRSGSLVPQCSQPGPLRGAPSTAEATEAVQGMCSSHSMPGCDSCKQGAAAGAEGCREPLVALSAVCASMPGMRDCRQLAEACGSGKDASISFPETCAFASSGGKNRKEKKGSSAASLAGSDAHSSGAFDLPPMRMFLHQDAEDIVLSRNWVPRSPGAVAAACLGAIAGGFMSQALRAARGVAEAAVAARLLRGGRGGGGLFSSPAAGARLGRNALRAAATFASSLLDLLLMLVAMTFSWPLIFSVAAGYGLGALVFGALGEPGPLGGGNGGRGEVGGNGDGGESDGKASAAAGNGFATSEGVHLHGGTEGVDGASCCDMGGEREREREGKKRRKRTRVRQKKTFPLFLFRFSSHPTLFFPFSLSLLLPHLKPNKTGGIGRAKLSPTLNGNEAAAEKGRGGWFGKP